jgi:integrase
MADLKRASRYANARRNLVIVRLACCCGLRASEIGGLQLDDVVVGVPRPHLRLRRETTKGKRPRMVPLWWDAGTLADLAAGSGGHEVRRMSTGVTILPEPACWRPSCIPAAVLSAQRALRCVRDDWLGC